MSVATVPIETLYDGLYDGPHATPKPSDAGPVFLGIGNITEDGKLNLDDVRHIAEEDYPTWTKRVTPQPGDIVFTYEATLNRYAIIPGGFRGCLGRRTALIRPNVAAVNPRFLFFYFFSEDWRKTIRNNILSGATVDRIPLTRFPTFPVTLPERTAQDRIADILSAYDDLIENNTRRIKILEGMAEMIYREWFVNFRFPGHQKVKMMASELGPIPGCWRVGHLEDAVVLQRGFDLPTAQRIPGNVPIIAATGFNGTHNVAKVKAPGVVTGRSGSLGTVMLVWEDFWPLNTALWAKEFRQSNPIHTYFTLQAIDLKGFNSGAAVPTLNRNDIHGLPTVLPDRETLEAFNECVIPLFTLKRNLEARNSNLRTTRDLLLPKLISSEVPVEAAAEVMEATA